MSLAGPVSLASASSLDHAGLAQLFTAVYADYWFPIQLDAAGFERMTVTTDVDLEASRVASIADSCVGIALLAVRAEQGWIGGMGVLPDRRRQGIGALLMHAVLDCARAIGLRHVTLEVLEQNDAARRVYERIGFATTRSLSVWTFRGSADQTSHSTRTVDADRAIELIAARRGVPEPWQRADGTLERLRELDSTTRALATDGGAVVYRVTDGRASIVQLAADGAAAARTLLAAVGADSSEVAFVNVPDDEPAAAALEVLGGTLLACQLEMTLAL